MRKEVDSCVVNKVNNYSILTIGKVQNEFYWLKTFDGNETILAPFLYPSYCLFYAVWVPHPQGSPFPGSPIPGSAISRVPDSQGPTVRAVFQGNTLGVETPVQNLHPRKLLITCFGESI